MAALETPWLDLMSPSTTTPGQGDENVQPTDPDGLTTAAFSPVPISRNTSANRQRSTILVHQKSPLLIATPPQVTRALAYSHAFILPLNKFVGLLTWTTGDSWESFVLVATFWAVVLYGDPVLTWAGPLVVVLGLVVGMWLRRYSPLSSTTMTGDKHKKGHKREPSELANTKHQKSLDEIVETLKEFTARCNMLLDPFIRLTDFLSTQRTATSATTRPALTSLFLRIILVTPVWIALTLPPFYIITTKRIVLTFGTLVLTWHSKPTRVSRELLWRSRLIRRISTAVTGLNFATVPLPPGKVPVPNGAQDRPGIARKPSNGVKEDASKAAVQAKRRPSQSGVKFTFILFENQRRWVGLGWTTSLFSYERSAWTDEHLNPMPSKEEFELPDVEGGNARWRWVQGSKWQVEGAKTGEDDEQGWIYYDNKWQNGRRGTDGWGKFTRRRKWHRDAELVEVTASTEVTPPGSPVLSAHSNEKPASYAPSVKSVAPSTTETLVSDSSSVKSGRSTGFRPNAAKRTSGIVASGVQRRGSEDLLSSRREQQERNRDWGIGDEARMGLE